MSIDRTYSCLSVGDFVDRANWLGVSPGLVTEVRELSRSVAQLQHNLVAWQSLTTQEFWQWSNWSGVAFSTGSDRDLALVVNSTFSLTLANEEFWRCFNWSNRKIAPSNSTQIVEEPAVSQSEEFTLENLSQLF